MPENPTVDLAREDDLDTMHIEVYEARHLIRNANWLEDNERLDALFKLGDLGWQVARGIIEPDPVDGSIVTTVVHEVRTLVEKVTQRDPARMELRAEALDAAGKAQKAAELRARAQKVRERIAQREARRGNG